MFKSLITQSIRAISSMVTRNGLSEMKFPSPFDYIFGDGNVRYQLTRTSRDWSDSLVMTERQNRGQETYSCVTQSALNCLEIHTKALTGLEVNYSDSYAAKVTNTDQRRGNSFVNFWDTVRRTGLVSEELRPFSAPPLGFYRPVTEVEKEAGKLWLSVYDVKYAWVFWGTPQPEKIWEALQYGPVQVSISASQRVIANGMYQKVNAPLDHAVTIFAGKYKHSFQIFDSYDPFLKVFAWDYGFGSGVQPTLNVRSKMQLVKAPGDSKVYAVDANGARHWIKNESQFNIGKDMGLWGDWTDIIDMPTIRLDKMPIDNNSLTI